MQLKRDLISHHVHLAKQYFTLVSGSLKLSNSCKDIAWMKKMKSKAATGIRGSRSISKRITPAPDWVGIKEEL